MDLAAYEESQRRNHRVNYWALFFDTFTFAVISKVLSPSINLSFWLSNFTRSEAVIGLIPLIGITGSMVSQLFFANWVNNMPRKKPAFVAATVISRGSMALFLLTTVVFGRSSGSAVPIAAFLASYGVYSLASGLVSPLWSNFVAQSIPEGRGRFLGTAYFVDGALGVAAAFGVRQLITSRPFPDNFALAFLILTAFSALTVLPALLYKETPYPGERRSQSTLEYFRQLPRMLRGNPVYSRLLAVRVIICFAEMSNAYFTIYAMKSVAATTADIGVFNILMIASGMLANLAWGRLGDRYGFKLVFQSAMVLGLVQLSLAMTARSAAAMYPVFFLLGAYGNAISISIMNLNLEVSPRDETPLFLGTANAITGPFLALAPQLGALLVALSGYRMLFSACIGVYALDFCLLTFWIRLPRTARPPSPRGPASG